MSLLAIGWTDLGAFVALGIASLLIAAHVIGLTLWLRRRRHEDGNYSGL